MNSIEERDSILEIDDSDIDFDLMTHIDPILDAGNGGHILHPSNKDPDNSVTLVPRDATINNQATMPVTFDECGSMNLLKHILSVIIQDDTGQIAEALENAGVHNVRDFMGLHRSKVKVLVIDKGQDRISLEPWLQLRITAYQSYVLYLNSDGEFGSHLDLTADDYHTFRSLTMNHTDPFKFRKRHTPNHIRYIQLEVHAYGRPLVEYDMLGKPYNAQFRLVNHREYVHHRKLQPTVSEGNIRSLGMNDSHDQNLRNSGDHDDVEDDAAPESMTFEVQAGVDSDEGQEFMESVYQDHLTHGAIKDDDAHALTTSDDQENSVHVGNKDNAHSESTHAVCFPDIQSELSVRSLVRLLRIDKDSTFATVNIDMEGKTKIDVESKTTIDLRSPSMSTQGPLHVVPPEAQAVLSTQDQDYLVSSNASKTSPLQDQDSYVWFAHPVTPSPKNHGQHREFFPPHG